MHPSTCGLCLPPLLPLPKGFSRGRIESQDRESPCTHPSTSMIVGELQGHLCSGATGPRPRGHSRTGARAARECAFLPSSVTKFFPKVDVSSESLFLKLIRLRAGHRGRIMRVDYPGTNTPFLDLCSCLSVSWRVGPAFSGVGWLRGKYFP